MSLLNQVLQDLENRNASNSPKQKKINQLKAASATQKNSYFFLIILLCLTAAIALINFIVNDDPVTAPLIQEPERNLEITDITPSQKPITPPTINISNINDRQESKQIKIKPEAQESIVKLESHSMTTPQLETKKKNQELTSKKIQIQTNKKSKNQRKKPYKQQQKYVTKKISLKQQAEKLFTQAKKEKNKITLQSTLEQILILNPKHRDARLLLANNLLNMGLLQ
jgi:hypothetical protein